MLATSSKPTPTRDMVYPEFITLAIEAVRQRQAVDSVIRIRVDMALRTYVNFIAHWVENFKRTRAIERRVFMKTAAEENGTHEVTFMAKAFDEDAVIRYYSHDQLEQIAKDIQGYLCLARLPE